MDAIDYTALGKRLEQARIDRGYSKKFLAEKTGLSAQHISNIESGRTSVGLDTLVRLANALAVSLDLLFDNHSGSEGYAPVDEEQESERGDDFVKEGISAVLAELAKVKDMP